MKGRMRRLAVLPWLACLIAFAACGQPAAPALIVDSPDRLIEGLRDCIHQNSQEAKEEADTLVRSLSAAGEDAVPKIQAALADPDERFRIELTRALSGIRGNAAASALLDVIAMNGSFSLTNTALGCLENREIRVSLTGPQLQALKALIGEAPVLRAGSAARVLGQCNALPVQYRLPVIVERFSRQVAAPPSTANYWTSYVSGRVFELNQYLLGISHMGSGAVPILQQERKRSAGDAELSKWLTIALGMAGDKSVAHDLEHLLNTEPDRYVRCVAVRAYARSAKQDAVPLLRELLKDQTRSEFMSCTEREPSRLIANVAADELARLGHPVRRNAP